MSVIIFSFTKFCFIQDASHELHEQRPKKNRKASSLDLLIPQSIKNNLLKVALDKSQVILIDVYTLFWHYESKYEIWID